VSIYKKVFATLELPVLTRLIRDAALKFIDVGGRGKAFSPLLPLASFADYYVAEPDDAEARRLVDQLPRQAPWRSVTVVPKAIANSADVRSLYITDKPGMSSLLEPDSRLTQRYYLGKKFGVTNVVQVPTIPLDSAASQYGFADATFLKIDTQGTELEVLQSGRQLLPSLVGIHTESMFQPFYKKQPLFADIDGFLRQAGFELVTLNRTMLRRAAYRRAVYSKREIAWAHCLYLRDATTLVAVPGASLKQIGRLLALAVAFQQFDLAFDIVSVVRSAGFLDDTESRQLDQDIERCAVYATRHVVRKAGSDGVAALMAGSFRDKSQFD
jgi:FkbM family methyltransferase